MSTIPFLTDDVTVFGLLMLILGFVFYTSEKISGFWSKFYKIVPSLLVAYMLPALFTSFGVIAPKWTTIAEDGELLTHTSKLYYVASRYLLPGALVLLTLSVNLKAIFKLGYKALLMFFAGAFGIIIGGPLAILIVATVSPETVGGVGADAVWRGLSTLAGSWIGGGANQIAMLEIYGFNPERYGGIVLVDVVIANLLLGVLLFGVGKRKPIDRWLKADTSAIEVLQKKVSDYSESVKRMPTLADYMILFAIAFGSVGIAYFLGDYVKEFLKINFTIINDKSSALSFLGSHFFWLISFSVIIGVGLSFTKLRNYEGAGASKLGNVCIYILVATIGMKINLLAVFDNFGLFAVGLIWIMIHLLTLIIVAKLIKAPYFFMAVGSMANVGGTASSLVVATAFHPALATVGVLLAVLGYVVGTYAALFTAELMRIVAP